MLTPTLCALIITGLATLGLLILAVIVFIYELGKDVGSRGR
jgi:hypothetical protein